jgi:transcriptional regulator with XRE-family HTH domain
MSKAMLLEKLTDKEYRDGFISEEIDVGLPMQLRSMRESRGLKQQYVAEKTGTKQPRFSLMEKAGYGNFSLSTLKKLASLFDVGLIVSFVPWGEMIDFVEGMTAARLNAIGFAIEYPRLLQRYSRSRSNLVSTTSSQISFDFEVNTATSKELVLLSDESRIYPKEPVEDIGYRDVPVELLATTETFKSMAAFTGR